MRAITTGTLVLAAALAMSPAVPGTPVGRGQALPPQVAHLMLELPSGRRLSSSRPELIATPVYPGSIIKIATLMAALDTGVITPRTRLTCRRRVEVDGRWLTCSHPELGQALGPDEALAHSCNSYFVTVASRLRRDALDRALVRLGLPPSSSATPLVSSSLGLAGMRATPEQLLRAFIRLTGDLGSRLPEAQRRVITEGLRGAAEVGTASALAEHGVSALAKTGTAPMPGGGYLGLIVAVSPAVKPTRALVVMAPGAAGMDAAGVAGELLAAQAPSGKVPPVPSAADVRIGVVGQDGRFTVVPMPLEDYVARVVSGEAAPASGIEARKALAIAARTYGVANRGRHARDGFDLCDLTHCQVLGADTRAGRDAARATAGQVLWDGPSVASIYYTASCGGHTERPSAVWPGGADPSYLPARPEPECREASAWRTEIGAGSLLRALRSAGSRGETLRDLRVVERTTSGRAATILADGLAPALLGGERFRLAVGRTLGWQMLKSTLFDIERTPTGYRFHGRGAGHGVGMCVAGAARRAAAGSRAEAILSAYYPGLQIRRVDSVPVVTRLRVLLPAGEERARDRIEELARAAFREIAARGGIAPPAAATLVFHATVQAYARATGLPWWTAAGTTGAQSDFIPPSALRTAGILEQTIRHEIGHQVTGERLEDRPIWVREAVAMFLSGELPDTHTGPTQPPSSPCPADAEWRAAGSAESLRRLYARAAACFAGQRAAGRRWDEIR